MPTRTESANEQAALYRSYLEAFDAISSLLLEQGLHEDMPALLKILADTVRSDFCGLYFTSLEEDNLKPASLHASWHRSSLLQLSVLDNLPLDKLPRLADSLQLGMLLAKPFAELPDTERHWFSSTAASHVICIPLLEGGEIFGCILLLDGETRAARQAFELRILGALTHDIALALVNQRVEQARDAYQARLKTLVGATEDMVFEFDQEGTILNVWSNHPAMPQRTLVGLPLEKALPLEMAQRFRERLPEVLAGQRVQVSVTSPRLTGHVHFIARLQATPAEHGEALTIVALVRDVTDMMQEDARRRTLLDTLNLLEEGIVDLSPDGVLLAASSAWSKLRGVSQTEAMADIGKPLLAWVHEEDHEKLQGTLATICQTQEPASVRFRMLRPNLDNVWLEAKLIAHHEPSGEFSSLRGVLRDITVAHLHERHIMQLALYDGLTGLPNRLLLDDLLHQALGRAKRNDLKVALGFIDLDHFKQINDTFGHKAGDDVLRTVANQLRSVLRDVDVLARWGGDEFVVMIPDLPDLHALRAVGDRLREIARQGVVIDGLTTKPTISIGIAVYPDNAGSGEELMSAADSTMYHAKTAGRNNVQFYNDIMHLKSLGREHLAIQSRLNNVVLDNELQVFFQPIVDARTGGIVSVEALVRWHDDKAGWISPELFIPMAEKLGLIQELGEQVMMASFSRLANWRANGLTQKLAFNLSRNQLFAPNFVGNLMDMLASFQLKPEDIIIEVTESLALTDYSRQSKHLRELAHTGFTIAIDDFGTGYSSLSQLHDMPIAMLKIDLSFTSRLNTESGRRIMQAIVQMGQALGIEVVVEGVENLESARFLQGLGVNRMQGFHFSEPVPPGVCELLMRLGLPNKI